MHAGSEHLLYDKILQFSTGVLADVRLACLMAVKWLCISKVFLVLWYASYLEVFVLFDVFFVAGCICWSKYTNTSTHIQQRPHLFVNINRRLVSSIVCPVSLPQHCQYAEQLQREGLFSKLNQFLTSWCCFLVLTCLQSVVELHRSLSLLAGREQCWWGW